MLQNFDYYSEHGNQNGDYRDLHNHRNGFADHHQETTHHNMVGYDRGEVEGADSEDEYHHQEIEENQHDAKQNGIGTNRSNNYYENGGTYTNGDYENGGTYTNGDYEQHYGDTSEQYHSCTTPNFPVEQQNGAAMEQQYGPAGDSKFPLNHVDTNNKFFIDQENFARQENGLSGQNGHPVGGQNGHPVGGHGSLASAPRPITVQYRGDGAADVQRNGTAQWMQNGSKTGDGMEPKKFRIHPIPGGGVPHEAVVGNAQQQFLETGLCPLNVQL